MKCAVASPAQRDQVVLRIITELASRLDVVNLQTGHGAARLAVPLVALQNRLTEQAVRLSIETKPRTFGAKHGHEAFCRPLRNSCF
jgi:hypothetical protein